MRAWIKIKTLNHFVKNLKTILNMSTDNVSDTLLCWNYPYASFELYLKYVSFQILFFFIKKSAWRHIHLSWWPFSVDFFQPWLLMFVFFHTAGDCWWFLHNVLMLQWHKHCSVYTNNFIHMSSFDPSPFLAHRYHQHLLAVVNGKWLLRFQCSCIKKVSDSMFCRLCLLSSIWVDILDYCPTLVQDQCVLHIKVLLHVFCPLVLGQESRIGS